MLTLVLITTSHTSYHTPSSKHTLTCSLFYSIYLTSYLITLQDALTSAYIGAYRGVNDHNLVLDRKYVDVLFRGIIEDYYFKESNRHQMWNNTESRIFAGD